MSKAPHRITKEIDKDNDGKVETVVQTTIADISTASSSWVVAPVAGDIDLIQTIIDTAITTGDATITVEINGVLVTGSSITIATAGSAAGDVDSASPTATKTVAVGDKIEVITDGGSTVASKAVVNIHIK